MRLTRIFVNIIRKSDSNCVAYVNIVFDNVFKVRGVRVVRRVDGRLKVLMPSRENKVGEYVESCVAIDSALREHIESMVLGHVNSELRSNGRSPAGP